MKGFERAIPDMPLPDAIHFEAGPRYVEHFMFRPAPDLWAGVWAFHSMNGYIFQYDCAPIDMGAPPSPEEFHRLRSGYYRKNGARYVRRQSDDLLQVVSLIYALAAEHQQGNPGGNNERPRQAA